MRSEPSKFTRTARWLVYPAVGLFVLTSVYVHYRELNEKRRGTIVRNAFASLSNASEQFASRIRNWHTVVSQAATGNEKKEDFSTYLKFLVRDLSPCTTAVARPVLSTEQLLPSGANGRVSIVAERYSAYYLRFEAEQCAQSRLDEVLSRILADIPENTFDDVLLATSNGTVVYQSSGMRMKVLSLASLFKDARTVVRQKDQSLAVAPGATADKKVHEEPDKSSGAAGEEALERGHGTFSRTTDFSNILQVHVGGEEYMALLQPVEIAPNEAGKTVLVGLIGSRKLAADSSATPVDVVVWSALGVVLVYCLVYALSCIPLKSSLQPIRRLDIATVSFFGLTCCAGFTAVLVHGYFVAIANRSDVDRRMRALATQIDINLAEELSRFSHVLDGMTKSRDFDVQFQTKTLTRSSLLKVRGESFATADDRTDATSIAYSFPFFDYVFWSDVQGNQIAKWSVRTRVTPKTPLAGFSWFQDAIQQRFLEIRAATAEQRRLLGRNSVRLVVEPLWSPNTGEYLTVMARRYDGTPSTGMQPFVGLLVAPLASLNSPVFPPGYGFALIKRNGTVLFSSNPSRNQRENFFAEAAYNGRLVQAVRTESSTSLSGEYGGRAVRMLVTPLRSIDYAPWALVLFRETSVDRAVEVSILLQTLAFMLPHGLITLALLITLRFGPRKGATGAVWPSEYRTSEYCVLLALLVLMAAFTWAEIMNASRSEAWLAATLLPSTAAVMATSLLRRRKFDVVQGALIYLVYAIVSGTIHEAQGTPRGLDLAMVALGTGVVLVAIFQDRLAALAAALLPQTKTIIASAGTTPEHGSAPRRSGDSDLWIQVYTACACAGVLLVAILPTITFYRISFEMVATAASMRDLMNTTRQLQIREDSIERYYRDIELAESPREKERFVQDRLSLSLDRYDQALPDRMLPVVKVGSPSAEAPLIDYWVKMLPGGRLDSPAAYLANTPGGVSGTRRQPRAATATPPVQSVSMTFPKQRFLFPAETMIQFDYRISTPDTRMASDRDAARWSYASLAQRLRGITGVHTTIAIGAGGILIGVYFVVYRTLRFLSFRRFGSPALMDTISLNQIPGLTKSTIVLGILNSGKSKELQALSSSTCGASVYYVDVGQVVTSKRIPAFARCGSPVVLDNFEFDLESEESARIKLDLLERILFGARRKVVIVSALDPREYFNEVLAERSRNPTALAAFLRDSEKRWSKLLGGFEVRRFEPDLATLLKNNSERDVAASIYGSCTEAQRAVLYQIAADGWVNPHNKAAVAALIARGWVRLNPVPLFTRPLHFMNRHVPELTSRKELSRWTSTQTKTPAWTILLWGGGIGVLLLVIFFGDMAQGWSGSLAPLLAAVTAIWKMVSEFKNRAAKPVAKEGLDV